MPTFLIQPLRAVLVATLCFPMLALGATSADLETLFYTPAERIDISRSRQGLAGAANAASTRLNGVVRRAGGKSTVWILRARSISLQSSARVLRNSTVL